MVKILKIKPLMTQDEAQGMIGNMLKAQDCKQLVTYDADVFCSETGVCIAKFRKHVIAPNIQEVAYESLKIAATPTNNRGSAGGVKDEQGKVTAPRKLKSGKVSKTLIANSQVSSGIVGYFDRTARTPNCRLTAFNQHHMPKFKLAYPIIKVVDNFYKQLMPKEYKAQEAMAKKTSPDFVIKGTVFTTVTVNKNYQTAAHTDSGDFKGGFGNLVAMRKGQYDGCYLVAVRWGVGFDLQNGDLLLMDVHQVHGNTPMIKLTKDATRLSLVMYYREKMINCGSLEEELHTVKNRKHGTKLN